MDTIKVEILNPKAVKLLQDLADLKLIAIQENKEPSFISYIQKIRKKAINAPSLDEITKEVEYVRAKRYAK
ncbi:hypothetical protein NF867_14505 [Solitalea sp. MAHUQ-68]|uniref:Uncharacterized protein n=1 Tax=Solitalea agri TaxID=2953739 RepID=A0A9X2F4H9_9SPHI|nr:hypothetical protein [Solitalea agri]MCO4294075.1 hypothetical protein [Solitalea agri]